MSKRYSGKSFKDSSVMKKPKLTFKEKRKLKEKKKRKDEKICHFRLRMNSLERQLLWQQSRKKKILAKKRDHSNWSRKV